MVQIKNIKKTNQFRAFIALTKASIIASLRNPTTLFFNFFFPFIFITIFGILGQGDIKFDVGIRSDSEKKGIFYEALKNTSVINMIEDKTNEQLTDDLSKGRLAIAITISKNSAPDTSMGQVLGNISPESIFIETSAASTDEAKTIVSIFNDIAASINENGNTAAQKTITLSSKTVEGRKYQQIDYILPGQLAFALLTNALFGISFTFLTMKKSLILKRLFASPVNKGAILGAEAFSKILIAILQAVLIITIGHFAYHFTLANGVITFINMMVLSLIGIIVFIGFGLLIASVAKNEDAVSPLANLIMMPQLFLSGAFFTIEAFPKFLQPIAHILPMTFLNEAFKKVAFEGASLMTTMPEIAGLILWGIILYLIVGFLFKWE